ncbi:MAG: hypothetical protein K1W25_18150 [Lachnospiraceae bacterium]
MAEKPGNKGKFDSFSILGWRFYLKFISIQPSFQKALVTLKVAGAFFTAEKCLFSAVFFVPLFLSGFVVVIWVGVNCGVKSIK